MAYVEKQWVESNWWARKASGGSGRNRRPRGL